MPDWKKLLRERMPSLAADDHDVITELAAHLEEAYEEAQARGHNRNSAIAFALQQVHDWRALAADIRRAKQEKHPMNNLTKKVWLPAIAVLFPVGLLLLVLDRAFAMQQVIWWTCMVLLLCAARSEAPRLNLRTKSVWLPGLISLTAASLFLFAEELVLAHDSSFYFTDISLRPDHLSSGLPRSFYVGWLLAQTLCGAVAAYLSRRAGGSLRARVVAAAFPAIVMFALWTLVIPASAVAEHNTFLWSHRLYYLFGVFVWVVPPAIALVTGAAPFLKETNTLEATEG